MTLLLTVLLLLAQDPAELIRGLGCESPAEREVAREKLFALGEAARDAVRKATSDSDANIAAHAKEILAVLDQYARLDELATAYREFGLPLPPKDAPLVRCEWGGVALDNNKELRQYVAGFLLREGNERDPQQILVGTQIARYLPTAEKVKPTLELAQGVSWHFSSSEWKIETNFGLALAIQCKTRGWNRLAQALYEALPRADSRDHDDPIMTSPKALTARATVALLAWTHWCNELTRPKTDRAELLKRLRQVLKAELALDSDARQEFLNALDAALKPNGAAGVEAMIDELTDLDDDDMKLIEQGFDAVPALIAHWNDTRVTRAYQQPLMNSSGRFLRVSDRVRALLSKLSSDALSHVSQSKDADAWWKEAQRQDEEAYLVSKLLTDEGRRVNGTILRVIAAKHPNRLGELYRTLLSRHPAVRSGEFTHAIGASSLPRETKLELLRLGADQQNLKDRHWALRELAVLDPDEFVRRLVATLDTLPKTPKEPYWACPEAGTIHLVMKTADVGAWRALQRAAERADVGLRLQYMNPMSDAHFGEQQRAERIHFLAAFLGDETVRDAEEGSKVYSGPHAGFTFRRLAVRDFAAMQLASILGLKERPMPNWTPDQFATLRRVVEEALKK
jgi:hypothetical protein